MKKLLFTLTLGVVLALGSQPAFAQAKKKTPTPAPAEAPAAAPAAPATEPAAAKAAKPLPMHTTVDSVEASSKSFTHKNKDGKVVKYVTTSKTQFKNDGKEAKFEDIKVGDEVNGLRLKKSDTEYEVVETTYIGAPKPKAPKPKAK